MGAFIFIDFLEASLPPSLLPSLVILIVGWGAKKFTMQWPQTVLVFRVDHDDDCNPDLNHAENVHSLQLISSHLLAFELTSRNHEISGSTGLDRK